MSEDVLLSEELSDEILRLTLNRPEKLNALDRSLLSGLADAIREANTEYTVLIVEGEGDAFTSGADLDEAEDAEVGSSVEYFQEATRAVRNFEGIVVGKLHGWVVGGGFEWTLSFDLRYAAEGATFRMPEPQIGVAVSNASTVLLPLFVGAGKARELLYTGADLEAEEALELGLLAGVYPEDELDDEVRSVAEEIVDNASREALWANKRGFNAGFPIEEALEYETLLGEWLGETQRSIDRE